MANQLQITGDTKVKSLSGVLTGTSGLVGSVPLGAANGVATLDSGGKVPVSQLPSSVVTYLGTWNAATNTPTLTNGVGDAGDMYICNVAGTVNFGAGPVTFAVGDWVLYGSGTWQKSNGQNGTVTSVGASITGNAIGLTGSPITTAGTLAFAFAGTSGQYVNGAGNLTTFPTLITSIGLSMPSAFSVANSPLTANGSINVTGAGTVSQYIDGTGALQTFPALTGYVPYTGATTDVDLGTHVLNAQALHVKGTAGAGHLGLKHQTASPTGSANESLIFADVNGNLGWLNGNLYLTTLVSNANTANRSYTFPNASGTLALTSDISYPVTSVFGRTGAVVATSGDYTTAQVTESGNLYFTDSRARLALSFVAGSGAYNSTTGVITIPTNNNQITNGAGYTTNVGTVTSVAATGGTGISITGSPITTSGTITITNTAPDQTVAITASTGISVTGTYPNFTITNTSPSSGGTVTSVAALTIGTSGTDLSSSVANSTTTPVITLNVPTASATNRGALSSADWTTFNNKQGAITLTTTGTSGAATFSANTLNIPNYAPDLSGYVTLATTQTISGAKTFTNNVTIRPTSGYNAYFQTSGTALRINYLNDALSANVSAAYRATDFVWQKGDGTDVLKLDSTGNLGLGVTPSAWGSGYSAIQNKVTSWFATSSRDANFGTNVFVNTSGNYAYIETAIASLYTQYQGQHSWQTAPSGTAGAAITFTQAMTLTAAGRLLLGTTTESTYLLDVNGTGRFSGNVVLSGSDSRFNGGDSVGRLILSNSNTTTYIGLYGATHPTIPYVMSFVVNSAAALTIASTGAATFSSSVTTGGDINANTSTAALKVYGYQVAKYSYFGYSSGYPGVIIGSSGSQSLFFNVDVSANPSGAFSGNGSEYVWRNSGTFLTPNASNNGYNKLFDWGTSGQMTIYNAATFSSSVTATSGVIESGGLNIKGTGATAKPDMLRLSNASAGAYYWDIWRDNTTGYLNFGGATGGSVSTFLTIKDVSGNVGIGTTSPSDLLDIYASSGTPAIRLSGAGAGTNTYRITGQLVGVSNTGFGIYDSTNSTYRLVITGTGNVLIGTTTDDGTKLRVNGAIKTAGFGSTTARTWKLGELVTATVIGVNTTGYLTVEVNGTQYNLALANLA